MKRTVSILFIVGIFSVLGAAAWRFEWFPMQAGDIEIRGGVEYKAVDIQKEMKKLRKRVLLDGAVRTLAYVGNTYRGHDPVAVHDILHYIGASLYEEHGPTGIVLCDDSYNWGCYHGFLGRAFVTEGNDYVGAAATACRDIEAGGATRGCSHGIGHGLMALSGTYDAHELLRALSACDGIERENERTSCYNGVFMEYNMQSMRTVSLGEPIVRPYNADNPYEPCDELPTQYQQDCYYEQADWWRMVLNRDFATIAKLCTELTYATARIGCYRGIGRGAWGESKFDWEKALVGCLALPEQGITPCTDVIVEELILLKNDPETAYRLCLTLGKSLTSSCLNHRESFLCETGIACEGEKQ